MNDLLCVECLRQAGLHADAAGHEKFLIDRSRSYNVLKPPAGKVQFWQIPSAITVWTGNAVCLECLNKLSRRAAEKKRTLVDSRA